VNTLAAFTDGGGTVDPQDKVPADVIRVLLEEAPP